MIPDAEHETGVPPWDLAGGDPRTTASSPREIAERKQAEEALRESEERFRATFEQAAVGLAHVAPDGRWLRVNRKLCDIVGYSNEELMQSTFQQITHPEDLAADLEQLRQVIDGSIQTYSMEKRYVRKNGSLVWIHLTVSLVRAPSGEPKYFISAVEDISRRREFEHERALLASIVDSTDDAIISRDVEDRILSWNAAAERIYGYTAAEMKGRSMSLLVPPEIEDDAAAFLKGVIEGRHYTRVETRRLRKDGRRIDVSVTVSPIRDSRGVIVGAATVARDITERKRAENSLRESLLEKETLLKEIHHRVKNSMQLVSSVLQLQSRGIKDPQALAVFREGQSRIRSVALVHEKLYQLGTLARIDFDGYVRSLVEMLVRAYRNQAQMVEVSLQIEPVSLNLDAAIPIGLILNELVSNSLKHAFPEGQRGTLQISLRQTETGCVVLTVEDDGVGMPREFDWKGGSSLGIRLIHILASQLRGKIEVRHDRGTAFTLTAPSTREPGERK